MWCSHAPRSRSAVSDSLGRSGLDAATVHHQGETADGHEADTEDAVELGLGVETGAREAAGARAGAAGDAADVGPRAARAGVAAAAAVAAARGRLDAGHDGLAVGARVDGRGACEAVTAVGRAQREAAVLGGEGRRRRT